MSSTVQAEIRAWLRDQSDGASVAELVDVTGRPRAVVHRALEHMGDAYVDRWVRNSAGGFAQVWCVVAVPEHCPRPDAEVAA